MSSYSPAAMASPSTSGRLRSGSPTSAPRPSLKIPYLSSLPPLAAPGPGLSPVAPSASASPVGTSNQSSPDALHAKTFHSSSCPSSCPTPAQLPDSAIVSPSLQSQHFLVDPFPSSSKPNIIRRVSRSAMNAPNRLLRHRQSSNNVADRDRDQSSGPLVMRRQNSADNEDVDLLTDQLNGTFQLPESIVKVSAGPPRDSQPEPYRSLIMPPTGAFTEPFGRADDSYGIVNRIPRVDSSLQKGTRLIKVTKKKRKELTFILDPSSVKITWHPTDNMKRLYIDDILDIRKKSEASHYRQELGMHEECEDRWFTIIYTDPNRVKGRPTKTMHLVAPDVPTYDKWIKNLEHIISRRQRTMQLLASGKQGNYDVILPELWKREMAKLTSAGSASTPSLVSGVVGGIASHASSSNGSSIGSSIDFLGVQTICRSLHMDCNREQLRQAFDVTDVRRAGSLNYDEFRSLFTLLKERSEIKAIYNELIDASSDGITLYSFFHFLNSVQGVDITQDPDRWAKVFHDCVHQLGSGSPSESPTSTSEEAMSLEAFTLFLNSPINDTLRNVQELPKLDRPLNEYFISSSHNTYLMGRQVAGMSSTEAYVMALKRNCRCVEIDCWDGDNGQPIVTHGRTMTTQVSFQDCISVIAKYAFAYNPYPLTLSLEVHCSPVQQQIMRNIMEREFGEQLVTAPLYDSNVLPSPEALKHRVLVKVKAHTPHSSPTSTMLGANKMISGRQRSMSSPQTRQPFLSNSQLPPLSSPPTVAPSIDSLDLSTCPVLPNRPSFSSLNNNNSSSTEESDAPHSLTPEGVVRQIPKAPKSKIVKALGELGIYTSGHKYRDFDYPEAKQYNHIFSLSESDFENLCLQEIRDKLLKHNAKYLMRVYPARKRIRSSNFNPLICWRRGVQMVALNWQTYDLGMQLNDAMFASEADSRGYVLKPREVYPGASMERIDDASKSPKGHKQQIRFSLELISGQQLPRPHNANPDTVSSPYVEIELLCAEDKKLGVATGEGGQDASRSGASGIGAAHRRRSRIVEKNGYNPAFRDTFTLSVATRYPGLVFVRWSVWSSPDGRSPSTNTTPLATFTAKLSDLAQGYRHLPLYNNNGEKLLSTLFCRIMKEQPISVEGFGRDDRESSDKPGRLRSITQALKRSISSSKDTKSTTLSRKGSATTRRRQSREKVSDANGTSAIEKRA